MRRVARASGNEASAPYATWDTSPEAFLVSGTRCAGGARPTAGSQPSYPTSQTTRAERRAGREGLADAAQPEHPGQRRQRDRPRAAVGHVQTVRSATVHFRREPSDDLLGLLYHEVPGILPRHLRLQPLGQLPRQRHRLLHDERHHRATDGASGQFEEHVAHE